MLVKGPMASCIPPYLLTRVYVSTGGCCMFQKPASRVVLMGHSWYPTLTPAWLTAWPESASDYPWVGTMGPVKCFAVPPDECLELEQNITEFYSPNPSHQTPERYHLDNICNSIIPMLFPELRVDLWQCSIALVLEWIRHSITQLWKTI